MGERINLDALKRRFPLGPPPELASHGCALSLNYEDRALIDPLLLHWAEVSATVQPEPHGLPDPDDTSFSLTYFVSRDSDQRLHSVDDQAAQYCFAPNSGFLEAYFYEHGSLRRHQDRPDTIMLELASDPIINTLRWSVQRRPNDGPTMVVNNGRSGQHLSWLPGRSDAPVSIAHDAIFWSLTVDQRRPTYPSQPTAVLLDIAYASDRPLDDNDASFLLLQLDLLQPEPRERALLGRVLARWQKKLSAELRAALSTID